MMFQINILNTHQHPVQYDYGARFRPSWSLQISCAEIHLQIGVYLSNFSKFDGILVAIHFSKCVIYKQIVLKIIVFVSSDVLFKRCF